VTGQPLQSEKKTTYQDVRDEVLRRIQGRIWDQGSLLPTEQELSEEFGCARATVNRALRELAERGIIDRKRKSGTRVTTAPVKQARLEISVTRHQVEETNASYRYRLVSREIVQAPDWLAAQMGLPAQARVLHLTCMHYADNRPFQHESRWINIDAVPDVDTADFSATGPNEWLLARVPFSDAEIALSSVAATADIASFLGAKEGTPLFLMERSTWFQGQPVTFVRLHFHEGYRMRTRY
jgi:GntR family histidine utilization transcriptional repressor